MEGFADRGENQGQREAGLNHMHRGLKSKKGYVLILTAVALAVVLGAAGLAVDLGRLYIVRSETQAFVDAAALAAAAQLDGTSTGISNARTAVANQPGAWNFGTQAFAGTTVKFALASAGNGNVPDQTTWASNPLNPSNYRFVRVTAGADVPLTLVQAVTNQVTAHVSGSAVGGQVMVTTYLDGLLPFSPIAPNTGDTVNYGFSTGTLYTLRYPPPGSQNASNVCPGDASGTYWTNLPSQDRGYWGSTSASAIRGEIVDDTQLQPISIGGDVPMVGGEKTTEGTALDTRVREDTDSTSTTYADYISGGKGNGRRLVGVPVNGGPPDFVAVA